MIGMPAAFGGMPSVNSFGSMPGVPQDASRVTRAPRLAKTDGIVTCPWHAWNFRLCDGAWCDNPQLKVEVFEVRVVDATIEVRVPPARPVELPTARPSTP
jgi:hypothetical protein